MNIILNNGSTLSACKNLNRKGIGIDNGICERDKIVNGVQLKGLPWVEITKLRLEGKI